MSIQKRIARRLRRLKAKFGMTTVQQYGNAMVILPADHLLPVYQNEHPLYDRFLPHLAQHLTAGQTVVDVGANCGDTLAAMLAGNDQLKYVCIEPDDFFFGFLEKNVQALTSAYPKIEIRLVKAMVGKSITGATLAGGWGTKKAIFETGGSSGIASRSLDSILQDPTQTEIGLLKSDVDGFDYDVLDSSVETLKRDEPLVFFETQCDFDYQVAGFKNTISDLQKIGYEEWTAFDNYGEVVIRSASGQAVIEIIEYIWRQKQGRSTRTMAYLDVLATTPRRRLIAEQAVHSYLLSSFGRSSS